MGILENIKDHNDLRKLTAPQREILCGEIRDFLISNVSMTGGHLASNLGVVELTVAIETVFNTQTDRLVFDVGHQSYVHKLLTGRQADFQHLRQFGGIAGFPKPSESITDAFTAGHASSSVSIALGMARARTLCDEDYDVVALIGDGSATGGLAFEGLSDAAVSHEPMIVVLNDNAMSIDRNVGGMAYHLRRLRTKTRYLGMKRRSKNLLAKVPGGDFTARGIRRIKDKVRRMLIPATLFETIGFSYFGPVNGHDTEHLIYLLEEAKQMRRPVVIHVITEKGRGYAPAQDQPELFHGVGKFDPDTGKSIDTKKQTFSDAFGSTLCQIADENDKICAITAAMPSGTGLSGFKDKFPQRTFDVGIAEGHAVSMAGGLAKQGMIPVVAIYSTFLQRAYDMILQDICLQKLHVVFAVDRAGLVGEDGETHHGVFDVGFLRQAPGMRVLCPASRQELSDMLRWSVNECNGPVAIRYPRGGDGVYVGSCMQCEVDVCRDGSDVTLITYGTTVNQVLAAAQILEWRNINAKILRLTSVAPLATDQILENIVGETCVVIEECCTDSGICDAIARAVSHKVRVSGLDLGHEYVTHGAVDVLRQQYRLSPEGIANYVMEVCGNEN